MLQAGQNQQNQYSYPQNIDCQQHSGHNLINIYAYVVNVVSCKWQCMDNCPYNWKYASTIRDLTHQTSTFLE